ncbi:MAG TPA: lamin tail domain-containing protein, partial [Polyangiaceae bacterium]|nr:lamin tail domain-containing protein [Polyangiaceae bacterium]
IINEVLANPQGAEPAQEWVELYNDGTGASELGDWTLSDGTGQSVLPAVVLRPGEYLIVTSEQYVPGGEDVPFAEGVVVVRVSSLGANGLGNSGEALQLISASGQVQSRFVARAASTGGVSIARVTPAAPDGAEASFARHGEPGASPGAPNIF